MKKKFNIILCAVIGTLSACSEYDFEQEQYRNEVSLLSNSNLVYDRQVSNLEEEISTIYLVATVSGSQLAPQSIHVGLQESDSLLKAYNKSNYDIEEQYFAQLLPKVCYDFPNMEMDIQAGTSKAMFPVHLKNLDKISPDSTIVIPNPSGSPEIRRPTNANRVFPLGAKTVRMMAGDEDLGEYKTARSRIVSKSIILEMGDQLPENPLAKEVTIKPHDKVKDVDAEPVDVVQLTPIDDYDNTFLLNVIRTPDGRATYYKEFRLHYKYRLESTAPYREVKAKLRYEFNPRVDNL